LHVIATAGHVDHGKSTLVRALTGINPDRLREEQQREMTIDLGFAWMNLPDGIPVGIIDVPGHIDFIDNMLAGVGGIDLALLVIAADEGPMPQTLEHLAILQLLQVQRAVVALTKSDLVDEEWIALISDDIRALLAPTVLHDAPIVPVSARANRGLDQLIATLATTLQQAPPRKDLGRPRLPIDRVFSVQGFGTVVTGTLVDGSWAIGDEAEVINPKGETFPVRIRGLQTHKHKLEQAQPGSRVAVNLSGVEMQQLARGSVLAKPHVLQPSTLLDVRLDLLAPLDKTRADAALIHLKHTAEVKVFSGAAQSLATVWLLEGNEAIAGQTVWAQLQLQSPLAVANGDRFIVRLPSPSITLGGGVVVDAHPQFRYRRRGGKADDAVLARLDALSRGTPTQRLMSALDVAQIADREIIRRQAQLDSSELDAALDKLTAIGQVRVVEGMIGWLADWQSLQQQAIERLTRFHQAQPLQEGMPRDTLRSQLKLDVRLFAALLAFAQENGTVVDLGDMVKGATHAVRFTPVQQRGVDALMAQCAAQPWNTPTVKDGKAAIGDEVFDVLLRQRKLVQCGPDVVLLPQTYDDAVQRIRAHIQREGQITAAQVRDLFSTSRKYALALLEHLDAVGITKRVGDARVLKG